MISHQRIARLEEVQSAILETIEECGQPMGMSDIMIMLAEQFRDSEIRSGVYSLIDECRLELSADRLFYLVS